MSSLCSEACSLEEKPLLEYIPDLYNNQVNILMKITLILLKL